MVMHIGHVPCSRARLFQPKAGAFPGRQNPKLIFAGFPATN
jgi:hypothetical protein